MRYTKSGYDADKNAYVVDEYDGAMWIAAYTAYPNFTQGTFTLYPRVVKKGEGTKIKKKIDMSLVES